MNANDIIDMVWDVKVNGFDMTEFIVYCPIILGEKFGRNYTISFESREHDFEFSSGCCLDTFLWIPLK